MVFSKDLHVKKTLTFCALLLWFLRARYFRTEGASLHRVAPRYHHRRRREDRIARRKLEEEKEKEHIAVEEERFWVWGET